MERETWPRVPSAKVLVRRHATSATAAASVLMENPVIIARVLSDAPAQSATGEVVPLPETAG